MVTHNFETLRRAVIAASVANGWAQAVVEWQVVGCSRGLKPPVSSRLLAMVCRPRGYVDRRRGSAALMGVGV